jgi:hypothetical protein
VRGVAVIDDFLCQVVTLTLIFSQTLHTSIRYASVTNAQRFSIDDHASEEEVDEVEHFDEDYVPGVSPEQPS